MSSFSLDLRYILKKGGIFYDKDRMRGDLYAYGEMESMGVDVDLCGAWGRRFVSAFALFTSHTVAFFARVAAFSCHFVSLQADCKSL